MIEKLADLPVIGINDFKKIKEYKNKKSFSLLIHRLKERGRIKKIEKGKYTLSDNPYLVATNIINPSYLSFWACSFYRGYTEQIVNTIQIANPIQKKELSFMNQKIEFIKIPKKLMFGFSRDRNGIFIAKDEKLIIDCVLFPEQVGNLDEIISIIKNCKVDREVMLEYLAGINNISLVKKVGYLLEKYKSINIYNETKEKINNDKNYAKLPFSEGKVINKRWRVKE